MKTTLFVYGTLKRGLANHALLAGQEFLGPARTLPRYRLYDCGPFPCLVEDPALGVAVEGELWRVDESVLPRLDELEEAPELFVRREVAIEGQPGPVQAYLYNRTVARWRDCGARWPSLS